MRVDFLEHEFEQKQVFRLGDVLTSSKPPIGSYLGIVFVGGIVVLVAVLV